ncbi:polysulfide reductase [Candidatus Methanoperedens nitroreducens]|uniref:Polysulfide reductase n=1 Tax=Candidatus Methanoperedens nitratireducens TaxID=1392998 RepID=A0A062V7R7_9EURY|nr:NrfD/PsrC family molybdoenzyme membrane anchor subunit [Candidatus Methanoperedens nitroreducens]KCZ73337.1 polysulfide reductase [Candidatus Methanoperedens nitroreducens]MDJ1422715.1 polysulfide reductase NrfD [Candidatus Methanoperedens sp.]
MAYKNIEYNKIEGKSIVYYGLIILFGLFIVTGVFEFFKTLQTGQVDLGVSDRVPWGMPIVMIEFLKGISAGLLLFSTLGYVFGKNEYRSISRIAAFLAIVVLIGAMAMILGELGKPLRFINVFIYGPAYLNSVFALNSFLYSGFIVVAIAYLWSILGERTQLARYLGTACIVLSVAVIAAGGSIFGFMIGRELWYSPFLPVLFITGALVSGVSMLILILIATTKLESKPIDEKIITGFGKYLLSFLLILAFFALIEAFTRMYGNEGGGEGLKFFLTGPYSSVFWVVYVLLGIAIPIGILLSGAGKKLYGVVAASFLAMIGILAEKYTLIITGQDLVQQQVAGRAIMGFEGMPAVYSVSAAELSIILGVIGGIGILYLVGLRMFKLLPSRT